MTSPTPMPPGEDVKLLSCPFCGGEAHTTVPRGRAEWVAECDISKGGCGIGAVRETEAEAIAAWNRRTPDPALAETCALAAIEFALERCAPDEALAFLADWREGFPRFSASLDAQTVPATKNPARNEEIR